MVPFLTSETTESREFQTGCVSPIFIESMSRGLRVDSLSNDIRFENKLRGIVSWCFCFWDVSMDQSETSFNNSVSRGTIYEID